MEGTYSATVVSTSPTFDSREKKMDVTGSVASLNTCEREREGGRDNTTLEREKRAMSGRETMMSERETMMSESENI
jgi:hypothetical protein